MFRVVPLCERQLRDVSPEDVLEGGLYRKCNVYKSGGGYDKFPSICLKRLRREVGYQFVVQLYGCPLKCPYCYVTPEGITGEYVQRSAEELVSSFVESKQEVFHLMGGAPALYMKSWPDILDILPTGSVFHGDLLLIEHKYDIEVLKM